eukprot:jgi/Ulvmu1/7304/UM035_0093.1
MLQAIKRTYNLAYLRDFLGNDVARRALSRVSGSDRDQLDYDVCIVGAGPAGLSAAIRLKQLANEAETSVDVCVLEKGAQVGAHILSGNVLDPRALNELFPKADPDDDMYGWELREAPVHLKAKSDRFSFLTSRRRWWMPCPPQMKNRGNYIISLSELTRWMAHQAELEGVDILDSCAAHDVLLDGKGSVKAVVTQEMGVAKDGTQKDSFMPGAQVNARVTMFAEGCRGSLSQRLISKLKLKEQVGAEHQTYGLGVKEVWKVAPEKHKEGHVEHMIGYPLDSWTYGGGFLYHMSDNRVALGFVVGLDYWNAYLSPFHEFQKFKAHPYVRRVLEDGTCLEYGARSLNEGGAQSVPKSSFGGGCLIGCAGGFLNVPRIKGTHMAMKTGILAAEAAFAEISLSRSSRAPLTMDDYQRQLDMSWVKFELEAVKNIRPGFKWGLWLGLANAALESYIYPWLWGGPPWTVPHNIPDNEATKPARSCKQIQYPKPDGEVTFDIATSLHRSGTGHDHDQPAHLRLKSSGAVHTVNARIYDGPETRYCPAGVYEHVEDSDTGRTKLLINAQNCLHCKACDIKDPTQNIVWTVPEGGGGPNYSMM